MTRIIDSLLTFIAAALFGTGTWFLARMVIGNVFNFVQAPDAALLVFTVGITSMCYLFAVMTLTALVFAVLFATDHYPHIFDED